MTFTERLRAQGLIKRAAAAMLGVTPETLSRWGDDPPRYALAWLEEYERREPR